MVVMLPFSQVEKTDATDLLKAQHTTGAAVRLFIKLGKAFEDNEEERQQIAKELEEERQQIAKELEEERQQIAKELEEERQQIAKELEEERQQIAKELEVKEQFNSEGIKESRIHKTYTILTHVCFLKAQYRRRRYLCIFRKVSFLLS